MSVKQYYILSFYLFCFYGLSLADTIGSPIQINTNSQPFGSSPIASFNIQTKQFLVGFMTNNSLCSLYDMTGSLVTGPITILNSNDNPIAFSAPVSCYNSVSNQFLISYVGWHGDTSTYFSILDQHLNSLVGPVELVNPSDDLNTKIVSCCYNSISNQYLIVWTSACSYAYFVILDASGNIVVDRTEINGLSVSDGRGVYVSYNATNNQYFFTWQDNVTSYPYFAIYDAVGSVVIAPTIINNTTVSYTTFVTSAYNSTNNQYMVVWNDTNDNAYFVIYDASGSVVVPMTIIIENSVDITGGGGLAVCHNPVENEYFISWNGNDNKIYYTIYSNQGVQKVPLRGLTSPDDNVYYNVLKSNACAGANNIYWFGWLSMLAGGSDSKGYFALYKREVITEQNNQTGTINNPAFIINYGNIFTSLPVNVSNATNIANFFSIALSYGTGKNLF
jgi:hypothetical protein